MRIRRVGAAFMLAALVMGSLLTGKGTAETVTLLPSLTRAALLEIAQIAAPPAGVGLQIHADFPEGAPLVLDGIAMHSLTADITPDGSVLVRSANAATAGEAGMQAVGECDDPTFLPTGVKWAAGTMPIPWHLDLVSTADELKWPRTVATIRSAHRIWPQAKTVCDRDAENSFSYDYQGPKRANPGYDKVSIVDFGPLGSKALAVNYTWYQGKDEIVEVDLRLNKIDYKWTNIEGVDRYNVKNVVAHELGHQFGLDDLNDPHSSLTMYALIGKAELNKTTLGRGDMRGAELLSP